MKITVKTAQSVDVKRNISKAKLAKNGGLEVTFEETVTFTDENGKTVELNREPSIICKNIPHDDLINAFALLRPHLAIITDCVEAHKKTLYDLDDDVESLEKFKVTSFSKGGTGEHEGVTISGSKKLSGGRILNLNTPFTKYYDENDPYDHADELSSLITHICNEVEAYLDGKIAPDAQLDMFESTDESEDFEGF